MRMRGVIVCVTALGIAAQAFALTITPSYDAKRWVHPHERIELQLSESVDGRIGVVAGVRDLSALFERRGEVLRYRNDAPPLPSGEQELVIFAIDSANAWKEIGRVPLRVLSRHGFEQDSFKPSLDIGSKNEIDAEALTERSDFNDVTGQGGFTSLIERDDLTIKAQANFQGASYVNEALRYPIEGSDAPRVDLATYRVDVARGKWALALGQIAFGAQRHLVNNFNSRGASLTYTFDPRWSLSLAAAHGTTIVGWNDVLGIEETNDRVVSATVGLELIPTRPNAARVELSLLDGTIEPRNGFNDAAVRSPGRSLGVGLRVLLADPKQWIAIDGGFTRSRYSAREDEEVEAGIDVRPLDDTDANAAYLDANVALIRNQTLRKQPVSVSAAVSLERIEPLFHSVAVALQPDVVHGSVALNGAIGPVALQLATLRSDDNLDEIRSLLKTRTRQTSLNVGLPLSAFWPKLHGLPTITAAASRTHQYGLWLPTNADFASAHVPDQISLTSQAQVEWQIHPIRFGARGAYSDQDNRNSGALFTDFVAESYGAYAGWSPSPRVDVSYDFTHDLQDNFDLAQREHARRHGLTLSVHLVRDLAVTGNYSRIVGRDDAGSRAQRASDAFVEISMPFRLYRSGRAYVRYTDREDTLFDSLFALDQTQSGWQLTTGVNVSVFP